MRVFLFTPLKQQLILDIKGYSYIIKDKWQWVSLRRDILSAMQPRRVSKDYAYNELKNRILSGDIQPEEDLIESRLAEELNISKTPLREALQKLEVEELVIRQPNGRLKTASITVKEVEELFLIRSYLEGIIVKQATDLATNEEIEELSNCCYKIAQATKYKESEEILRYGKQFHTMLYDISGNRTAVKILTQLNDHLARYRRLVPDNKDSDSNDHAVILEHIKNGEGTEAEETMRNHVISSMGTAIAAIKRYELES